MNPITSCRTEGDSATHLIANPTTAANTRTAARRLNCSDAALETSGRYVSLGLGLDWLLFQIWRGATTFAAGRMAPGTPGQKRNLGNPGRPCSLRGMAGGGTSRLE